MYKVIASGVFEGEPFSAETKPKKTRKAARRLMRKLVREAEEANDYQSPDNCGKDDFEKSIAVSPDCHRYEFNDMSDDYLQWDVVPA